MYLFAIVRYGLLEFVYQAKQAQSKSQHGQDLAHAPNQSAVPALVLESDAGMNERTGISSPLPSETAPVCHAQLALSPFLLVAYLCFR